MPVPITSGGVKLPVFTDLRDVRVAPVDLAAEVAALDRGDSTLGRELGRGSRGHVRVVKRRGGDQGRPPLVVKLANQHPGRPGRWLQQEVEVLDQFRAMGIRTAHHGIASFTSGGSPTPGCSSRGSTGP